jgi:maltose/moltooligosaccharide transporter
MADKRRGRAIMAGLKPHLSTSKILQMNLGFLGLQYSFGLQQANMSPIWGYLGAHEKDFAWLGIAGPLTGFILQPIIGVMSDRTGGRWGRRTPYFLIGAVLCALGLFLMPLSASILMAFSVLLLLDVGNNVTMEPYRAYVNDRLNPDQRPFGFLSQSAFTGLAQTLAYLSPSLLVGFGLSQTSATDGIPGFVIASFWIGAALSLVTILWSILSVPELPLSDEERARIAALPKSVGATFAEIFEAMKDMPQAMRTMGWMSLFQWYAMCGLWGYANNAVARSVFNTADNQSVAFQEAQLLYGKVGALYNFLAFVAAAFILPPLARKFGAARMHAVCLLALAAALLAMPHISSPVAIYLPAIGLGLGWASIMGNPYIVLASAIPAERTGVYMGIFNMMITAPMILFAFTMPFLYEPVLGNDPRNVLTFSGILMILAAISVSRVRTASSEPLTPATT